MVARWIKVVESRRWNSVTVRVRTWHPSFWRFIARELRKGEYRLSVVAGRFHLTLPSWFVAEVGAIYVLARLALGKAER
jgi:hypothetical protein